MPRPKKIKIVNGDQEGYCTEASLGVWERNGWTVAEESDKPNGWTAEDDGSSEESPAAVAEGPDEEG